MIVQSRRIWIDDTFIEAQLVIEHDKITYIQPYDYEKPDYDFGMNRIVPGFIDIHTHGSHRIDTWTGTSKEIEAWMKFLLEEGITGVCPTIMTQNEDVMTSSLHAIRECYQNNADGASILGIHIEGTCIQNHKSSSTSTDIFKNYQSISNNLIKIMTINPEKDNDFSLTKYCSSHDVCVSLGHCTPSYEIACLAYANGARGVTHVFNGMNKLNPRKQELINIALQFDHLYGEIICDGKDVTPDLLNLYFNHKKEHAIMITDTFALKGLAVGSHMNLMGNELYVAKDNCIRMKSNNLYAGPSLKMNEQFQLLVEEAYVPWKYAIHSYTINPASYLRVDDHKGRICTGYDADFVVLNDDYTINSTFVLGRCLYRN